MSVVTKMKKKDSISEINPIILENLMILKVIRYFLIQTIVEKVQNYEKKNNNFDRINLKQANIDQNIEESKLSFKQAKPKTDHVNVDITPNTMKAKFDQKYFGQFMNKPKSNPHGTKVRFYKSNNFVQGALNTSFKKRLLNTSDMFTNDQQM